ncbi:MAG: hypothetical protein K8I29_04365 [Alphaproteobacteria bacterium]|uniref:Uncharacterized protein n=1 Tax=Candidatus Nitrobium versatile TaxID=2884831 RepID=A0A953JAA9_9BACT|nr:hypothetical protein [Candidatus Nitrobium versatile]
MKKIVELVLLKTEEGYRKEYEATYLHGTLNLRDIPVTFSAKDFDHIFFEPSGSPVGYQFSFRRARRMNFMRALLSGEIDIEIMFESDRGTIALFCEALECVMYLRIRPGTGVLQVGSFFDFGKDHTKMLRKQKKKCVPITIEELKEKVK